jgi:hypothetical protein
LSLSKRREEDPRVEWIADEIWEKCWEKQRKYFEEEVDIDRRLKRIKLILDIAGKPNYSTVVSLARDIVKLMDKYGVSFDAFSVEDDVDCSLERSELISVLAVKWSGGRIVSLYDFVNDVLDTLEYDIYSIESQIKDLERMTPEELREKGLTEEQRRELIEELKAELARARMEYDRVKRQMRVGVRRRPSKRELVKAGVYRDLYKYMTTRRRPLMIWEIEVKKPPPAQPPLPAEISTLLSEIASMLADAKSRVERVNAVFKPLWDRVWKIGEEADRVWKLYLEGKLEEVIMEGERVLRDLEALEKEIIDASRNYGREPDRARLILDDVGGR